MVRLMTISELDSVLKLVKEQDLNTLREALPHLNVYVYEEEGHIKGFTYILDGYCIGDLIVEDASLKGSIEQELLEVLKSKYDELLINISEDDSYLKAILESISFAFEETYLDESSGETLHSYAFYT